MGSNDRKTTFRLLEDGLPYDDVSHVAASEEQLRSFERAAEQMRQFKAPALWDPKDRHSYMLFGLLDGTGNDVGQDPLHPTNVARLREEIRKLKAAGIDNVVAEYLPGPGTQTNFVKNALDGGLGATALDREEAMYWMLVRRAQDIYRNDPDAKISIHLEGFSRGASTVPMVTRLIHDRGIPDMDQPVYVQDANGKSVPTYPHHLKAPGQTPMSVGLYDPVPTGVQEFVDRRLPPSVVSGFQINSADELRKPFPVDRIIPQGLSADGRFLSVTVSGVHADVGGWYLRNGLSDRSMNLMTDYRNALSSQPLFQRLHETDDPRMNVVHQSHTNWKFRYTGMVDRADPEGEITRLTPDMTHATRPGQVVHVFEQAPEPANDMARRFHAQAQPVERTLQVGSPEQSGAGGLMARLARDPNVELHPYTPPRAMPAGTKAALGGLAVSATLTGIEWRDTYQHAQVFKHTLGNETAADDAYARQAAQTTGAMAGTVAGAATATALGTGSGGTLVLVAVEGYVFGKAAERAVTMWQNDKIYTQTDTAGVEWEFNGRKWIRDDLRADLVDDGQTIAHRQSFAAQPDKARELSQMASVEAVEQALGKVPEPRSPFVQPQSEADSAHYKVTDWSYSAETGRWSRQIANGVDRRDMTAWEPEPEYASRERAAQLSAQAMAVIDDNLKSGPAAIAARYEVGHKAYGYAGQVPDAVATALSPDLLQASDGKHYQRDAQGRWTHEGEVASANRALELELTRERLVPALALHQQTLASMPAWQPPTPEEADRALLRDVYLDNHWNPDLKPEQFEAVYAAVQRTRAEHGITLGTTAFALDRDVNGGYSFDSPIQHTKFDANGVVQVVATTRPNEVALAADVQTSLSGDQVTPIQTGPERSIAHLSPEARDAREQAQREANRQGLSQDDAQQAVRAAAIGKAPVGGTARSDGQIPEDASPRERAEDAPVPQTVPLAVTTDTAVARDARDDDSARLERERADAAQHDTTERVRHDETQADRAIAMETDRPPVVPTNERDREIAPPTATVPEARTSAEDPTAPTSQNRSVTPERIPASDPERTAGTTEPAPVTERHIERPPVQTLVREAQDARIAASAVPAERDPDALRLGDHNDQVELLQYRLDRQGYRGPDGEPIPQTGQYGPETEHAVRQFQTLHGLPATGVADLDTRQAVDHALSAQRERGEPGRSPPPDATPTHEARESAIETPVARRSSSAGRDTDAASEPERAPVARAEAPPATVAAPDPVLAHRAVSREERDDERQPGHVREHAHTADAPAPSAPLVTQPAHPAHAMYAQALNALRTSPNIPAGTFTQHEEEKLAAGLVAQALTQPDRFPKPQVDAVVMNSDGTKLIAVHGPLDSPANRLAPVDIQQSLSVASIEQSSDVSRAAMQALQQQQEQAQVKAETMDVDVVTSTGPVMRIGARTMAPASGPNGDGGGDGGGGGGGGG